MLIVCDFDGTLTARDTNSELAVRFAAERYAALEGRLARREITVRETLAGEFEGLDVPLADLVDAALAIPIRRGFRELVEATRAAGGEFVLMSTGFRQIIEPLLERDGLLDLAPLRANDMVETAGGLHLEWRDMPDCERCGEHCKRSEVTRLRAGDLPEVSRAHEHVVFIGDGFSDRCGADAADRIFARDSLAAWLDEQGLVWESWNDFHDITRALGLGAHAPAASVHPGPPGPAA